MTAYGPFPPSPRNSLVLIGFSLIQLVGTPWTVACQAPLSVGFSRQEFPYNKFESGETIAPPSSPFAFILIFVFFSNK